AITNLLSCFYNLDWISVALLTNIGKDVRLFWLSLLLVYGFFLIMCTKMKTINGVMMLVNLSFSSIISISFFSPDLYWTKFIAYLTLAMTWRCAPFFKSD